MDCNVQFAYHSLYHVCGILIYVLNFSQNSRIGFFFHKNFYYFNKILRKALTRPSQAIKMTSHAIRLVKVSKDSFRNMLPLLVKVLYTASIKLGFYVKINIENNQVHLKLPDLLPIQKRIFLNIFAAKII